MFEAHLRKLIQLTHTGDPRKVISWASEDAINWYVACEELYELPSDCDIQNTRSYRKQYNLLTVFQVKILVAMAPMTPVSNLVKELVDGVGVARETPFIKQRVCCL